MADLLFKNHNNFYVKIVLVNNDNNKMNSIGSYFNKLSPVAGSTGNTGCHKTRKTSICARFPFEDDGVISRNLNHLLCVRNFKRRYSFVKEVQRWCGVPVDSEVDKTECVCVCVR